MRISTLLTLPALINGELTNVQLHQRDPGFLQNKIDAAAVHVSDSVIEVTQDDVLKIDDMKKRIKDHTRIGWTDRIFYHEGNDNVDIQVLDYRSPTLRPLPDGRLTSDHRPVRLVIKMCSKEPIKGEKNGKNVVGAAKFTNKRCIDVVLITYNISGHPTRIMEHDQIFEDLFVDTACGAEGDGAKFGCDFVSFNVQELVELKMTVKSAWRLANINSWSTDLQKWIAESLGSNFTPLEENIPNPVTGLFTAGFARTDNPGFRIQHRQTCTDDSRATKGGVHLNYEVEYLIAPNKYATGFKIGVTNVHLASGEDVEENAPKRQKHLHEVMQTFESLKNLQHPNNFSQFMLGDFNLRSADMDQSKELFDMLKSGEDSHKSIKQKTLDLFQSADEYHAVWKPAVAQLKREGPQMVHGEVGSENEGQWKLEQPKMGFLRFMEGFVEPLYSGFRAPTYSYKGK